MKFKYSNMVEVDFTGNPVYKALSKKALELADKLEGEVFSTHLNSDKTCAYNILFKDGQSVDTFTNTLLDFEIEYRCKRSAHDTVEEILLERERHCKVFGEAPSYLLVGEEERLLLECFAREIGVINSKVVRKSTFQGMQVLVVDKESFLGVR